MVRTVWLRMVRKIGMANRIVSMVENMVIMVHHWFQGQSVLGPVLKSELAVALDGHVEAGSVLEVWNRSNSHLIWAPSGSSHTKKRSAWALAEIAQSNRASLAQLAVISATWFPPQTAADRGGVGFDGWACKVPNHAGNCGGFCARLLDVSQRGTVKYHMAMGQY